MLDYLNSNFISALWRAAVGALIPVAIEWRREQYRILSDINMTIGRFEFALKYLIDLKRSHAYPLKEAFQHNKKLYLAKQFSELSLLSYECHPFHFTTVERIFSCVSAKDILKKVMYNVLIAERSLHRVENTYARWNKTFEEFECLTQEEKYERFFGLPIPSHSSPKEGKPVMRKIDERIPNAIGALLQSLDDALYYVDQSLQSLEAMRHKALKLRWLRKRVLEVKISEHDCTWITKENDKETNNNA